MRVGVLGTGMVGKTLASKLAQLGHEVTMGSRSADNEEAAAWASRMGRSTRSASPAASGWRSTS